MKKIITILLIAAGIWGFLYLMRSCQKQLPPTTVSIRDSIRHYYPVVLGDKLYITCELTNTGKEKLAITEIQPSNFAITLNSPMPRVIPPGQSEYVSFIYNTEKNVGFAEHTIRFFGNINPEGVASLTFDTHIVRPTIDGSDYEEYFYKNSQDMFEEMVDGERGQKGYWVDGSDEDSAYQRSYKKYLIY